MKTEDEEPREDDAEEAEETPDLEAEDASASEDESEEPSADADEDSPDEEEAGGEEPLASEDESEEPAADEDSPGEEEEKEEAEAADSPDAESPEAAEEKPQRRRAPWPVRFLFGLVRFVFFLVLYLTTGVVAFVGGIGWYYLDATTDYDLDRVAQLSTGAQVVDLEGRPIGRIGATDRRILVREDIPPNVVNALIAAEDQRFLIHPGFDPIGLVRAAWTNYQADAIREGASTLTQQLARDVYGLSGREIERKLIELGISFWIEQRYSKDEILVHYLNRVYFGSGFYGAGAAAHGFFGKPLAEISVDEAAMLCGIIRSPSRLSPYVSPEAAIASRNQTLRRMHAIEMLDDAELMRLLESATPVADARDEQIQRGQASFLLSRIEKEVRQQIGERSLEGLVIRSSVDLDLQQSAANEIDRHLLRLQREKKDVAGIEELEGSLIVLENETGRIVVTVGSRDFAGSEYDRSLDMKRPTGSAFLPFLYAAAFEEPDFGPESILLDAPLDNRLMGLGGMGGVLGEWSTENPENRWDGRIPAIEALRQSKNSPSARLGLQLGMEPLARVTRGAGIETELGPLAGTLLGASEVGLLEMTRAYSIFPNRGVPTPIPHLVRSIVTSEGESVGLAEPPPADPAISEASAATIAEALDRSPEDPSTFAGQSGTTPGFTDAWHFGFDDRYTWGLWIGRDAYEEIFPLAFGGEIARPIADGWIRENLVNRPGDKPAEQAPSEEKPPTIIAKEIGGEESSSAKVSKTRPAVPPLTGPDPYRTLPIDG